MSESDWGPKYTPRDEHLGDLALALAKAQAAFPPIKRDKKVTVQTKSGGSYSFNYAPLDAIFEATRQPLADNGLAVSQLLDGADLITLLLHGSGACLTSRTAIASGAGIQEFGSAITYLRRYALQAILGITADEDDDGNAAQGNRVKDRKETRDEERKETPSTEPTPLGPWTGSGKLTVRKSGVADGALRQGPDGGYFMVAFDATDDKNIPQVLVKDPLAVDLLEAAGSNLNGLVCEIGGDLFSVPYEKDGFSRPFQRLHLAWIRTAGWSLPAPAVAETHSGPVEPSSTVHAGAPTPEDEAELDLALGLVK